MEDPSGSSDLFRTSFLERGLVTYAECVEHYQGFGADALLDEMRLLLTAPMLAIPFGVSSARYYALMSALVRCAGMERDLSDGQRTKLIRICVDIGSFLRSRASEKRAGAFDTAMSSALESVREAAVRPNVADEIAAGLRTGQDSSAELPAKPTPADDIQALDFGEPPPGFRMAVSA